jgi:small subunit ribosomal protein S20
MANIASAEKRIRQTVKRRRRNRDHRSRMRSSVKSLRGLIDSGETEAARQALLATLSLLDACAQKGVIHVNAAARSKSRLTRAVQKLG